MENGEWKKGFRNRERSQLGRCFSHFPFSILHFLPSCLGALVASARALWKTMRLPNDEVKMEHAAFGLPFGSRIEVDRIRVMGCIANSESDNHNNMKTLRIENGKWRMENGFPCSGAFPTGTMFFSFSFLNSPFPPFVSWCLGGLILLWKRRTQRLRLRRRSRCSGRGCRS